VQSRFPLERERQKALRLEVCAIADYLQYAIHCRILAEAVAEPQDKKILEELARAWEKIAAMREHDLIDAKDNDRLIV
jgi:hypothetical protein